MTVKVTCDRVCDARLQLAGPTDDGATAQAVKKLRIRQGRGATAKRRRLHKPDPAPHFPDVVKMP